MQRSIPYFGFLLAFALLTAIILATEHPNGANASAPPNRGASGGYLLPPATPYTSCVATPLSFNITGMSPLEDTRPYTVTAGETYLQFAPAPPITTTGSSDGYVMVNSGFSGGIIGGITGTFTITSLNGLAITNSTAGPEARGFHVGRVVFRDQGGAITALLAVNFTSADSAAPYYPRTISGFLHSIATSGTYAPYKFTGTISGNVGILSASTVILTASVQGRLYSGGDLYGGSMSGSRVVPPTRQVMLSPTDVVAQFVRSDFQAGTLPAAINPGAAFYGHAGSPISGTFSLDHNSLIIGPNATGNGWLAGNLWLTDTNGDLQYGPWIADLPNVATRAYFFQAGGTGLHANGSALATFQGAISYNGGADIAGGLGGVACQDFGPPSQTPTPIPTATTQPTQTPNPVPTNTATHGPPSPTTIPPGTASPIPTATPTSTAIPCSASFTDVNPSDYFYQAVNYLYCAGAITGYGSEFRPYGNTTRGQLCKIVVLAERWPIYLPTDPTFSDVPAGSIFYPYVETAHNRGIVNGYGNEFRPNSNATRGQISKIVVLARGWNIYTPPTPTFSDVLLGSTYYTYIETAYHERVISGYGNSTFQPNSNATRGQISKIVYYAINRAIHRR